MLENAYNIAQEFDSKIIVSEHFVLAALRDENGYAFKIL
ncbi:MAG: Clp protease N-terminal domain-containing protein, partial [Muribaculaceae bacterium]|nr:Clp protease N-terminal domain-containing protein [Muribaculaceae bacterium]